MQSIPVDSTVSATRTALKYKKRISCGVELSDVPMCVCESEKKRSETYVHLFECTIDANANSRTNDVHECALADHKRALSKMKWKLMYLCICILYIC